jgi:general nucleoside transport system ATP-binding protein
VAAAWSLQAKGLVKRFGSLRANDGIDVTFRAGEVHALLGENGAGKSTLVKVIAGLYQPDEGVIEVAGAPATIDSPLDARALGIAVVHQQSTLVPALTVLENAALVGGGLGRVDPALGDRLVATAESLGFEADPSARVERLSVGQRQRVEIARALMHEARIVLLDEPTSVLAPQERIGLFDMLQRITEAGTGVVLVTHRLDEALSQCGRLTALRRGRVVGESDSPAELEERELVRMLVGDVRTYAKETRPAGEPVLEVEHLSGRPLDGGRELRDVSLTVGAGEVLGVAGVEGNGQRELTAALVGHWRPDTGSVRLLGRPVQDHPPSERSRLIADIPDDEALAVVPELPVWQNLAVGALAWSAAPTPRNRARQRRRAEQLVEEFEIKTRDIETPVALLSGGNRRRVVLARELSREPKLVVASYATKGLDVRSIEQVKEWIGRLAAAGAAVVYVAAELEELLDVSDRVAVMAQGRITGELPAAGADIDELGRLMLTEVKDRQEAA